MSVTITPIFNVSSIGIDISCIRFYEINVSDFVTYNSLNESNTKVVIKSTTFPDSSKITVSSDIADTNIITISPFNTASDATSYAGIVNGKTYSIIYNIQNGSNIEVGDIDGEIRFRYFIEELGLRNSTLISPSLNPNNTSTAYMAYMNKDSNVIIIKGSYNSLTHVNNIFRSFDVNLDGSVIERNHTGLTFATGDYNLGISIDGSTVAHRDGSGCKLAEWDGTSYTSLGTIGTCNSFYCSIFRNGTGINNPGKLYCANIPGSNAGGILSVIKIDNSNNLSFSTIPGIRLGSLYGSRFKFYMSNDFKIVSSVTTVGTFDRYVYVYENINNTPASDDTGAWVAVGNPFLLSTSVPSIFQFYSDPYDETSNIDNVDITTPIGGNTGVVGSNINMGMVSICSKDSNDIYHLMVGANIYYGSDTNIVYRTFFYYRLESPGDWTYISCLPTFTNNLLVKSYNLDRGTHVELSNDCERLYITQQPGSANVLPALNTTQNTNLSSSYIYFKRNTTTNMWKAYGNHSNDFIPYIQNSDPSTLYFTTVKQLLNNHNTNRRLDQLFTFPNKNIDKFFTCYFTTGTRTNTYIGYLDTPAPIARNDVLPTSINKLVTSSQLFTSKDGYSPQLADNMNNNVNSTLVITNYGTITPADVTVDSVNGTFTVNNLNTYSDNTYTLIYAWENEVGIRGNEASLKFTLDTPVPVNDSLEIFQTIPTTLNVLANDGNYLLTNGTPVVVNNPDNLDISINGNNFVITPPNGNFTLNDNYTFTYDVEVSNVATGFPATVNLTVVPDIILVDDPISSGPAKFISQTLGGSIDILTNDVGVSGKTPIIIQPLTNVDTTQTFPGVVTINLTTKEAEIPNTLSGGNYSFTYDVSFNGGVTGNPATVNFYIAPNEVVLNADGPTEVFNNNSTLIDVLDNDLNVENAVPYIVNDGGVTGVTFDLNKNLVIPQSVSGVSPNITTLFPNGPYTITYGVNFNGIPQGSTTTVSINVIDPIILVDDTFNLTSGGGEIDVIQNDINVTGRTIIPKSLLNGQPVAVNVLNNKFIIPSGLSNGSHQFTYTVSFNSGEFNGTATVTINIGTSNQITLVDNLNVEIQYTGGLIDVLNNDDIGSRNPLTEVSVVITDNIINPLDPLNNNIVTVSNNKLVIPPNLPLGIYSLQYDVEDLINSSVLTGVPATVTFKVVVSSVNGTLPSGNPSNINLTLNPYAFGDNVIFVRNPSLTVDSIKFILTENYSGGNQKKVDEIVNKTIPMFRNSGGISHRGIISKLNTKSIQDDGFEFITEIKTFN